MSNLYRTSQGKSKLIGIKPIKVEFDREEDIQSKSDQAERLIGEAKTRIEQATKQAEAIIDKARQQVEQEKQNWENEKQNLIEQAKEIGYNDGFEHGKQVSIEQFEQHVLQARETIDLAKKDYQEIVSQSEDAVLTLGIRAASKILRSKLEEETEFVNFVKEILQEVKEQASIIITAAPGDYKIILEHKEELLSIVNDQTELYIYPDTKLDKGSCVMETPFGKIDASVDNQLIELRNKLFEIAQGEQ